MDPGTRVGIVEFLRARIAEDEALVGQVEEEDRDDKHELGITTMGLFEHFGIFISAGRLAAECEAKRAILDICTRDTAQLADLEAGRRLDGRNPLLRELARVYRNHPDFDPQWAENTYSGQHRY
jgi:hypothetical protein